MTYYKKVELGTAWEEVQKYIIENVLPKEPENLQSKLFGINDTDFMSFIYKTLKDPLECYGFKNRIPKGAILFGNDPNKSYGIHIDGYSLTRKNASNYALNIPIQNCENGYMNWYTGDYKLNETKTDEGLALLKINWNGNPIVVERTLVDVPTLVQVNIPHNVENLSDKRRLMLSLRFVPDLVLSN